jgi:glutamate N-acetyltransferase/amino-acid N-acetyltransferase
VAVKWPHGFTSAGGAARIKTDGSLDVGLLVADRPVSWAGVFTQNAACAAPVRASRSRLGGKVRAVIVNSGNANACTGPQGDAATDLTIEETAAAIGCAPEEVLIASTGPIGVTLPVERLVDSLPGLSGALTDDVEPFAAAILTTDTAMKTSSIISRGVTITGVAKGAAMLAPNMATMLAFITTDAYVSPPRLQAIVERVAGRTFNRICVDACESTNDSVFVFAGGTVATDESTFEEALQVVCADLARQMVGDAEGGSHLVEIHIEGAESEEAAAELGRAVASSALWRAAMHGADPNWGRVLSALGTHRELRLLDLELSIGGETLFADGAPTGDMAVAAVAMKEPSYEVRCIVGRGPGEAQVLTTDLSPEYVTLNAGGLT